MKTPSMNLFDYLFLSAVIVEIFTVIAAWDYFVMMIHTNVWLGGGGPQAQLFVSGLAPWLVGISFVFSFLLWAFISLFRWGVFRYVLAACVGQEIIGLCFDVMDPVMLGWFVLAGCISTGLKVAATVIVFRSDAGEWLRREV